ncbi:MAG: hypothetical protein ACOYXT_26330 [Bacteroidota bacterium]
MKKMIKFWVGGILVLALQSQAVFAQKVDDARMERDIEVAENVLATLIKQELNAQRMFIGLDIKGTYQPGYGVTFRLPSDHMMPMSFAIATPKGSRILTEDVNGEGFSYSFEIDDDDLRDDNDNEKVKEKQKDGYKLKEKSVARKRLSADSLREVYYKKVIKASKDFIVDYGDFISQLGPNERIIVTNRNDGHRIWVGQYFENKKRTHLSIEATKADITAFKQGKLTRDQALNKVNVVNTESVAEKEPDMELMASIMNRLYRSDLSTTFFTEDNIGYERLKDYGVIYYMQVYSSNERDYHRYAMPTLGLDDVDMETRNKKVIEVYPKFEQDMKENILEYGRTLKSLKNEEVLVFNITLTKCKDCGIPSTLELIIKSSVLKDFGMGKIDKNAALAKFTVKKGANQ